MSFLRKKEDDVLKNINLEENNNLFLGNILTVISLVVTAVFFSIIDKTPDNVIKKKDFNFLCFERTTWMDFFREFGYAIFGKSDV